MGTKARTRTRKTTTAKKPPAPARTHAASTAELRQALPVRPLGPRSDTELACARAALANAEARLPIPVTAWHADPNGQANTILGNTVITHTGRTPHFTAYTPCPNGAHHQHTLTGPADLTEARTRAARCTSPHLPPRPAQTPKVLPLSNGLHRARIAAEETTELSTADIAAGLAERTAAADEPKEHPQP
ncbi:hypothetical protein AB0933_32640 [Streptomyces venezuelae]|uniref:hypothetical protein n=1 Tax=Streptomyces venezuelae TaxID=54571 RepID=UPI003451437D